MPKSTSWWASAPIVAPTSSTTPAATVGQIAAIAGCSMSIVHGAQGDFDIAISALVIGGGDDVGIAGLHLLDRLPSTTSSGPWPGAALARHVDAMSQRTAPVTEASCGNLSSSGRTASARPKTRNRISGRRLATRASAGRWTRTVATLPIARRNIGRLGVHRSLARYRHGFWSWRPAASARAQCVSERARNNQVLFSSDFSFFSVRPLRAPHPAREPPGRASHRPCADKDRSKARRTPLRGPDVDAVAGEDFRAVGTVDFDQYFAALTEPFAAKLQLLGQEHTGHRLR